MPAWHREATTQDKVRKRGVERAAARLEDTIEEPDRGLGVGAKTDHRGRAGPHRRRGESRIMRIVTVQHGDAAGFEPEKDFGLGIGDRLDRGEKAEMGGLDRGDHCDVRPRQPSENGYLAGMVHAQLENAVRGIGRHPGERQRRTPMIVEAACGSEGWAAGGERQAQRLLGAGLADTARYREDPGAAAFARRRA